MVLFPPAFLEKTPVDKCSATGDGAYIAVLPSPVCAYHCRHGQIPKLLSVEAFLSEGCSEALHVSALQKSSRLDLECLVPILAKLVA